MIDRFAGRRRPGRWRRLAPLLLAPLLLACGGGPLLSAVEVSPELITPDQDGQADVAAIRYRVGAPARITMTLVAEDGSRHLLRADEPRAPREDFVALFGGEIDGRVLPDGRYELVVEARADGGDGARAEARRSLEIRGADTRPPALLGFVLRPERFTPNQDGISDRVAISYRLEEEAEMQVWLETAEGERITDLLGEQRTGEPPGSQGPHVLDYDAGVDADAPPPPDGDYVVVARARDAAGNVTEARAPLTIADGGQPRAALIGDVDWSATLLPLGETLHFTATVRNVGNTPIRTRGPEPGHRYDNDESYNLQAPAEWLLLARQGEDAATLRVPYDEAGAEAILELHGAARSATAPTRGPSGDAAEPTATAVNREDGAEVDAAEAAEVDGEADAETDADGGEAGGPQAGTGAEGTGQGGAPERLTRLCGRVLREGAPVEGAEVFAFEADGDNGRRAQADANGRFCVEDLPLAPAYERSFARSSGAIRLGLEYTDSRTDLSYPYRWQLGETESLDVCQAGDAHYLCLPPGETRQIRGALRFVEAPFRRSTELNLALLHEDVRIMHGPYNPERLTVEFEADREP